MTEYKLTIMGATKEWEFPISGKPEWAKDWETDGLSISNMEGKPKEPLTLKSFVNSINNTSKKYGVFVNGKRKKWSFHVYLTPDKAEEMRNDELVVHEVLNSIPAWWVNMGLPVKVWCVLEDLRLVW